MSDESPEPEVAPDFLSPLRTLLTEIHEMYQELLTVGFPERAAVEIISRIVSDSMIYRVSESDDEYDEEDEEDSDNDRGIE